ncbi:MAG: tetratricopeptide repeat protein [Lentisphaerae bacterium]|nr:tetratricopeptide repeat protein [Lentisphaerota bacterium]
MKSFLRNIFAATVLALPVLYAGEQPEQKLADTALAAGDYSNAIGGYHNAMLQADKLRDAEGWAQSALKLCRTYLRAGDLNNAKKVLAEFRRRHPLRSAGTLPGDLLVAEGKFAAAEQIFAAVAAGDPASLPAVNFSRGMLKLRSGDLDGAYRLFAELAAGKSEWAAEARIEALYILIRAGKNSEAEKFLKSIPKEQQNGVWAVELYLVEAYAGKTAKLKEDFDKFIESQPVHPHIRLLELLAAAAKTAEKNGDFAFAVKCLRAALDFSPKEEIGRGLHRQLIRIYADHFPELAAAEARKYAKNFPQASDRGEVFNFVGRKLLTRPAMVWQAVEIFTEAALNSFFPLADRLEAASDAISAAVKLQKAADLSELYLFLCHNSLHAAEKGLWHCRFAGFLEEQKDFDGALREYRAALQVTPAVGREKIHFELMNFFQRTGDEKNLLKEAELLSKSANMQFQADARFLLAKALEQRGEFAAARKYYLDAARVKKCKNQENAQFLAALMAYRDNFDDEAAKEFVDFAVAHEKSALTPHALYLALEILHSTDNPELKEKAATLFRTKYSKSEAWAYYVLNHTGNENIAGAITDLEKLEKNFTDSVAGLEIALQKAVFLDKNGKTDQALTIFSGLTSNNKSAIIAAEGALHAGEILFRRSEYPQARAMFLLAAKLDPETLLADIAIIRAVDCDLIQGVSPAPEVLAETTARCEQLAVNTKYPQIRLQAFYKLGLCHEWAGNFNAAVSAFEKLLYAARAIAAAGVTPEAQWCIRGTETALELLVRHRTPGALQRGMRMIRQLEYLGLKQDGMQKKFREQLDKIRRK